MTKEEYFARKVPEVKRKARAKSALSQEDKEILKVSRGIKAACTIAGVGAVMFISALALAISGMFHSKATANKITSENKDEIATFKTEQVEKLNQAYAGGSGFSVEEYNKRYSALQNNLFYDYVTNFASEDVKAEYQTQTAIDNGLYISSAVFAPAGCAVVLCGLAGACANEIRRGEIAKEYCPSLDKSGIL